MCSCVCLLCTGGAGGKGTWGKLVEVYDDDGHTHDHRDPNYDSEEEVVCYMCNLTSNHSLCVDSHTQCVYTVHTHAHTHTVT